MFKVESYLSDPSPRPACPARELAEGSDSRQLELMQYLFAPGKEPSLKT